MNSMTGSVSIAMAGLGVLVAQIVASSALGETLEVKAQRQPNFIVVLAEDSQHRAVIVELQKLLHTNPVAKESPLWAAPAPH